MSTKIVHVTHSMEIGGTEQVIMQLVRGLDPERYTNVVVCIDGLVGEMGKQLEGEGVHLHALSREAGLDRNLIKSLRELLKSEEADLVHCHQYTPYTYGVLAALGLDTKVVFTEHGRFYPESYTWKRRLINPLLVLATDAIVSISEATRQALGRYEWIPTRRIEVIYNGLLATTTDTQPDKAGLLGTDRPALLEDSCCLVGTVARLDPIKNHSMMIRAIGQLQQKWPDSRLVIVGDGPERETLEQLTSELGLEEAVLFTGFKNNPADYINLFDIFLLTSDSEGTSMTLLEAMAHKIPCIVTNVGGNPELIQHQHNGLLIERGNVEQLVHALDTLLSDVTLGNTLAAQAQEDFAERFELQKMIDGYQDLYNRVLGD